MHSFRWQEWNTISGGTATVTQGEHEWLDLEPYQDVFFWLQVSGITGSPTLTYQTSPTADDSLFAGMTPAITLAASLTPVVTSVLMLSASIPLARFVRWQLSGTPTWSASFRIMVAANAPGMQSVRTYLVQDWVTIRGPGAGTTTQSEHTWLHLPDVANAVAWLDVKEVTPGGGTIKMGYQTSPEEDDSMFVALTGPTTTVPFAPSTGVSVTPLIRELLGFGNGLSLATGAPLSGWFRWQITAVGSFTSTWDITFRLFLAAHCLKARQAAWGQSGQSDRTDSQRLGSPEEEAHA